MKHSIGYHEAAAYERQSLGLARRGRCIFIGLVSLTM